MPIPQGAAESIVHDGYLSLDPTEEIKCAVAATIRAAYSFFRSPLHQKLQNTLSADCGYRPQCIEYSDSAERPDQVESFTATARPLDLSGLGTPEGRALYQQMCETIKVLEPIAEALATALAQLAGSQGTSHLRGAFRNWSCLQMNYARPPESNEEFINDPHEDGHLLTLAYADGPGLEIENSTGEYMALPRSKGRILVMPGGVASLLSGGLVRPLFHQVRRDPLLQERMALLYFGDIDPDCCKPWVLNEKNADVDIGALTRSNALRFGLQGFESD